MRGTGWRAPFERAVFVLLLNVLMALIVGAHAEAAFDGKPPTCACLLDGGTLTLIISDMRSNLAGQSFIMEKE